VDQSSPIVITADRKDEQHKKHTAGLVVKEKTYRKKINIPQRYLFIKHRIDQQYYREESPEEKLREQ
jgi:hypothetical protein